MHPRDKYPRTICGCADCRKPCQVGMGGNLAPGDMGRIAAHLDAMPDSILTMFRASPGAIVGKDTVWGRRVFRIGTIVPATKDDGSCIFLDEAGQCKIHPVAPYGCSHFDWHMSRADADPRSADCLREIMADPEYQRKWWSLHTRGLTTEPPEMKRARLEKLIQ